VLKEQMDLVVLQELQELLGLLELPELLVRMVFLLDKYTTLTKVKIQMFQVIK